MPRPNKQRILILLCLFTGTSALALRMLTGPATAAGEATGPLACLAAGNERFARGEPLREHQTLERRSEIARGQRPLAVIVGCSDARVPPELVFDQGLGDLYVVRCSGGVLGDAAIGSIEYAVEHLHCTLVVVLAHERCGAISAVLQGERLPGHLAALVPGIDPVAVEARARGGDVLDNTVRLSAERMADELSTSEPILAPAVRAGTLSIVPARYDLDTGVVEWLGGTEALAAPALPAQ